VITVLFEAVFVAAFRLLLIYRANSSRSGCRRPLRGELVFRSGSNYGILAEGVRVEYCEMVDGIREGNAHGDKGLWVGVSVGTEKLGGR
jgi:hypothetical protein